MSKSTTPNLPLNLPAVTLELLRKHFPSLPTSLTREVERDGAAVVEPKPDLVAFVQDYARVVVAEAVAAIHAGEVERLKAGLKWYADGNHFLADDWDTVSGEPENWLFPPEDASSTAAMLENGNVAKIILDGGYIVDDADSDVVAEAAMTRAQHDSKLAEVKRLVELNPGPDSAEGRKLQLLAAELERHEKRAFPLIWAGVASAPQWPDRASDTVLMDWLSQQFVKVRIPLRYGSRECFECSPDEEEDSSNLRDAVSEQIALEKRKRA